MSDSLSELIERCLELAPADRERLIGVLSQLTTNADLSSLSLFPWLLAARAPYLNFLRNLTPQILLASLAWLMGSRLDFTRFDLNYVQTMQTMGFGIFFILFIFSCYASSSLFLEELFPDLMPWFKSRESSLQCANVSRLRMAMSLVKAIFAERKLEVLIAVIMIFILEFVFAGVLVSSIAAALRFIRVAHG